MQGVCQNRHLEIRKAGWITIGAERQGIDLGAKPGLHMRQKRETVEELS
jgi:hypothetical protein